MNGLSRCPPLDPRISTRLGWPGLEDSNKVGERFVSKVCMWRRLGPDAA